MHKSRFYYGRRRHVRFSQQQKGNNNKTVNFQIVSQRETKLASVIVVSMTDEGGGGEIKPLGVVVAVTFDAPANCFCSVRNPVAHSHDAEMKNRDKIFPGRLSATHDKEKERGGCR